jgi:muramidase (phage lysozyme)
MATRPKGIVMPITFSKKLQDFIGVGDATNEKTSLSLNSNDSSGDSTKKDMEAGATVPASSSVSDLDHPNVKKFLEYTSKAEDADYNTIVGGKVFTDYSKHPGIVGITTKSEGKSTAAGRYQITETTYKDVAPKLNITDFKPESQDAIALELIKQNNALDDVKSGRFDKAINKLGKVWASFPSSTYGQKKRSWDWTKQQLGMNTVPSSLVSYKKGNVTVNIPESFK